MNRNDGTMRRQHRSTDAAGSNKLPADASEDASKGASKQAVLLTRAAQLALCFGVIHPPRRRITAMYHSGHMAACGISTRVVPSDFDSAQHRACQLNEAAMTTQLPACTSAVPM